jgi:hypothetical protein
MRALSRPVTAAALSFRSTERLRGPHSVDDDDDDVAFAATRRGFGGSSSSCCSDGGNEEVVVPMPQLSAQAGNGMV